MTQYGTWLSYGGDAGIWLAIGLLAVAGGAALAGIPSAPLPAALNIASKILAFPTPSPCSCPSRPRKSRHPSPIATSRPGPLARSPP